MTRSDVSPWLARARRGALPAWPRLRGAASADVAVVGGGLTGCLAACLLARGGASVALLEEGRIAQGEAARSAGRLTPGPGARFSDLRERHGLRVACHLLESSRRAVLEFASLLRRLRVRCDLEISDVVEVAVTEGQAGALDREYGALRDAGFEVSWLPASRVRQGLGLDAAGAMRMPGGATVDPLRTCLGLARHAERAGASLFEQTGATRVRAHRTGVEVTTERGILHAGKVVVASDMPGAGFGSLLRHVRAVDRYAVGLPPFGAAARRAFGGLRVVTRDGADPAHEWHWTKDGRLFFTGGDQPPVHTKQRDAARVQRGAQLMYELSLLHPDVSGLLPEFCWATRLVCSGDGVLLAGTHRHFPNHVFAIAPGNGGLTASALAARVAVRLVLGAPEKGDELFGFGR
jgi:gamma-glutamylputrescine oxidase